MAQDMLIVETQRAFHAELLVELISKKNNLWSYYGRWAFLAADECQCSETDTYSQYDDYYSESDYNYCDGECCNKDKNPFYTYW